MPLVVPRRTVQGGDTCPQPFQLGPKEGLALLNGTQASTALALHAALRLERVFDSAVAVGAMTVDWALR